MTTITIPKSLAGKDALVVIPKREFDAFIVRAGGQITEQDILNWSREAKNFIALVSSIFRYW